MEEKILYKSGELGTRADKARSAADVGKTALQTGVSKQRAGEIATHELSHALADTGPGSMEVVDTGSSGPDRFRAQYRHEPLSSRDQINVSSAPLKRGGQLSGMDGTKHKVSS